jgi:hypothetical protein
MRLHFTAQEGFHQWPIGSVERIPSFLSKVSHALKMLKRLAGKIQK